MSRPRRSHPIVAIIPLYNGARFIEEALASVLAQTRQPDEIIVVDDGSTDAGPSLVERLALNAPVRLLRKPNGGQGSARNLGVASSSGALIALLDQDDVWYPHHLEVLARPFAEDRPVPLGWSYSNLDEIDERGRLITKSFLNTLRSTHPKRQLVECLREDMFILPSASLISRRAFDAVGGFDDRLSGYEDDDLFLRLFCAGFDNIFLDEPLSKWRIYPGSTSYSPRMARSRMVYFQKLVQLFPDDAGRSRHYLHLVAPRFYMDLMSEYDRALTRDDKDDFERVLGDLHQVAPYLSPRLRLKLHARLGVLRSFPLAKATLALRKLTRPSS